jgi:hypothetical protein
MQSSSVRYRLVQRVERNSMTRHRRAEHRGMTWQGSPQPNAGSRQSKPERLAVDAAPNSVSKSMVNSGAGRPGHLLRAERRVFIAFDGCATR